MGDQPGFSKRALNQSKKQHKLAVSLLKELRLDYVRLEPQGNGRYQYLAWNTPVVDGNGGPRISRRGVVRQQQAS
jgi:hypothetical protein